MGLNSNEAEEVRASYRRSLEEYDEKSVARSKTFAP